MIKTVIKDQGAVIRRVPGRDADPKSITVFSKTATPEKHRIFVETKARYDGVLHMHSDMLCDRAQKLF